MQPNADQFTEKAWEAIVASQNLCREKHHQSIESEHLLLSILQDNDLAISIFKKLENDIDGLIKELRDLLSKKASLNKKPESIYLSENFSKLLNESENIKTSFTDRFISIEHLLLALSSDEGCCQTLLNKRNIDKTKLLQAVNQVRGNQKVIDQNPEGKFQSLEKYGRDLTSAASEGKLDPVIGRDEEIRRTIQILSRRTKNNPVLIGEPGVGKTAIVEGLAQRIVNSDVPSALQKRQLISLDMGALIAGAKYRGEFEERLKAVLKEIKSSQGKIILFIERVNFL